MDAERDPGPLPEVSSLAREWAPPPDLEERTVAALSRTGLLQTRRDSRAWILQAAAALILLVSGVALGRATAPASPPAGTMSAPRYLLLLYGGPTGLTADQESSVAREYGAWAGRLRGEARFVSGERLDDRSVTVPPLDLPDVANLRGFFLISARDLEEAIALARDSPHVRRGGHVIVRPIDPT